MSLPPNKEQSFYGQRITEMLRSAQERDYRIMRYFAGPARWKARSVVIRDRANQGSKQ